MVICKLDDYNITFTFIQVDCYWETPRSRLQAVHSKLVSVIDLFIFYFNVFYLVSNLFMVLVCSFNFAFVKYTFIYGGIT